MKKIWKRLRAMHGRVDKMEDVSSMRNISWKRFKRDKMAMFSVAVLISIFLIVYIVPLFFHVSYSDVNLAIAKQAPSRAHLLGTDEYGRDILIRLIYGGRVSVTVAIAAMTMQILIGVTLGALAGYFGSWVDTVIMRITDVFMCFPFYIMAVSLAAILGKGLKNSILIIGLLSWTGLARMVRAQIMSVKENDYVLAAKSLGIPPGRIVFKHIIPNIISPIIVSATLSIAGAIMSEASLSYLGMGVAVPQPSWGNMLSAAQNMSVLGGQWWRWVPPGLMIVIVVLAVNYIGEGIEKAVNPKAGK